MTPCARHSRDTWPADAVHPASPGPYRPSDSPRRSSLSRLLLVRLQGARFAVPYPVTGGADTPPGPDHSRRHDPPSHDDVSRTYRLPLPNPTAKPASDDATTRRRAHARHRVTHNPKHPQCADAHHGPNTPAPHYSTTTTTVWRPTPPTQQRGCSIRQTRRRPSGPPRPLDKSPTAPTRPPQRPVVTPDAPTLARRLAGDQSHPRQTPGTQSPNHRRSHLTVRHTQQRLRHHAKAHPIVTSPQPQTPMA